MRSRSSGADDVEEAVTFRSPGCNVAEWPPADNVADASPEPPLPGGLTFRGVRSNSDRSVNKDDAPRPARQFALAGRVCGVHGYARARGETSSFETCVLPGAVGVAEA